MEKTGTVMQPKNRSAEPPGGQSPDIPETRKVGVVLFQLGGPDSLDAVEPFLYNLFCDPDIIDFPFAKIARQPLARILSSGRAKKVQKCYASIGGKSPIQEWTARQARALEAALRPSLDARVVVAMRYWHPFTSEAIQELGRSQYNEIVLLPLYPQYSKTTTGSSFKEWDRLFPAVSFPNLKIRRIQDFFGHPRYIESVVERIKAGLQKFGEPVEPHLLFSAHGLPVSVIHSGDPYQAQVEETVRLVLQQGRWGLPSTVCYQSKVGSSRWLEPSTHEVIRQLGAQRVRQVLVIPISFVSDHIETLHELDMEIREEAGRAGIGQFEMTAGLNDSPRFIRALVDLVEAAVGRAIPSASGR
ncbi:MAG: ferrochelatase [Acidobacteria bacterium]|nr:ferrochelatase [Acidobacteriota bacterium]